MRQACPVAVSTVLILGIFTGLSGCGEPPPDDEQLMLYLKNARVGGKVRRQWSDGQEYVDAVLAANAEYLETLEPLIAVRHGEYLWPRDTDKWLDRATIEKRIAELDKILADDAARERFEALQALEKAVTDVPAGLFKDDGRTQIFIDAVFMQGLKWRGADPRMLEADLAALAAEHKMLYAKALAADAEPEPPLRNALPSDAALGTFPRAFYELTLKLLTVLDNDIQRARNVVSETTDLIEKLGEEKAALKQTLRKQTTTNADRAELKWIDEQSDYQRARQKYYEDQLKKLERRRAKELAAFRAWAETDPAPTTQP